MQPEVGHEVLWVIRDCLSGEILLAKTLLSSRNEDLAALLTLLAKAIILFTNTIQMEGSEFLTAK